MRKLLFFPLFFIACTQSEPNSSEPEKENETTVNTRKSTFNVLVTEQPEGGFGYQLFQDGKMIIDQKHIPAIQGNVTFSTKEDAEKVSLFIQRKVEKGIFPPTISVEELDSLGVLK